MGIDITPGFRLGITDALKTGASLAKGWVGGTNNPTRGVVDLGSRTNQVVNAYRGVKGASTSRSSNPAASTDNGNYDAFSAQSDPYAKWGGSDAYGRLVSGFDAQKDNIFGTARDAAANAGIGYKNSILDFIDSLKSGQRQVDEQGIQSDLAKKQGYDSILDMVGRGIRSGGVMLANKNAGDSSAAGALSRAYGDMGRREMSGIGNQYEQQQREIDMAQQDLMDQQASGVRKLGDSKTQMVNNIVAEARNSLASLDAQMLEADLPTRIAIEQEKAKIKDDVLGQLSRFDAQLNSGISGIKRLTPEQRRAQAYQRAAEGVAPENAFQYNDTAPGQFQNTGPFAGDLPLFSLPRGRDERLA